MDMTPPIINKIKKISDVPLIGTMLESYKNTKPKQNKSLVITLYSVTRGT